MTLDEKELFAQMRVLINDADGKVWTDAMLEPFLAEAINKVPMIAAAVFGISRGAYQSAEAYLSLAGLTRHNPLDMLEKKEQV
jgi:hypothetical protein